MKVKLGPWMTVEKPVHVYAEDLCHLPGQDHVHAIIVQILDQGHHTTLDQDEVHDLLWIKLLELKNPEKTKRNILNTLRIQIFLQIQIETNKFIF